MAEEKKKRIKRTIEGGRYDAGKNPPKKRAKGPRTPYGVLSDMKGAFPKAVKKDSKQTRTITGKKPKKGKKR